MGMMSTSEKSAARVSMAPFHSVPVMGRRLHKPQIHKSIH